MIYTPTYDIMCMTHGDEDYEITYYDCDEMHLVQTSLVIRVESINRKVGSLAGFLELHGLSGITNGKLLILTDQDPIEFMIKVTMDVLDTERLELTEDFLFVFHRIMPTDEQCNLLMEKLNYYAFDCEIHDRPWWIRYDNYLNGDLMVALQ